MICIYPIGIPSLYATLLWRKRHFLRDENAMLREAPFHFPNVGALLFLVQRCVEQQRG
jgi:hypothetical protein